MRAALRPRCTFAEYLEIERRRREIKHEYVCGEVFAMAARLGPADPHSRRGRQLDSPCEYEIVAQDRRQVELWRRDREGWTHAVYDWGNAVPLSSVGNALDVSGALLEAEYTGHRP